MSRPPLGAQDRRRAVAFDTDGDGVEFLQRRVLFERVGDLDDESAE